MRVYVSVCSWIILMCLLGQVFGSQLQGCRQCVRPAGSPECVLTVLGGSRPGVGKK